MLDWLRALGIGPPEKQITWTGADGNVLEISKMETKHVFNVIRLIERKRWTGDKAGTVAVCCKHQSYIDLCKEFDKRVQDGRVTMADLFF